MFDEARRVPDTGVLDYLALMPLIWAAQSKLVGDAIPCKGTLYQRLVQPLLLAALNVDPPEGSAGLAGAVVRETLLAGGQACRPLIARDGLSAVLVEPAIKLLQDKGASIPFGHELREFAMSADSVGELRFGDDTVAIQPGDAVVMAVPPRPAASLLPGLKTPTKFRAIVNAHFRFDPPRDSRRFSALSVGWFFDIPVDNIYSAPILLGDVWKRGYQDVVVVSPTSVAWCVHRRSPSGWTPTLPSSTSGALGRTWPPS